MVLPVIVFVILFIALLIGYPWHVLSAGTLLFLCSLPIGFMSYREHERRALQATAAAASPDAEPDEPLAEKTPDAQQDNRPQRLN